MLINALLDMLSPNLVKSFAELCLDWVENYVIGTGTDIDDKILLKLCDTIRATFDIPDNDEEDTEDVIEKV